MSIFTVLVLVELFPKILTGYMTLNAPTPIGLLRNFNTYKFNGSTVYVQSANEG